MRVEVAAFHGAPAYGAQGDHGPFRGGPQDGVEAVLGARVRSGRHVPGLLSLVWGVWDGPSVPTGASGPVGAPTGAAAAASGWGAGPGGRWHCPRDRGGVGRAPASRDVSHGGD